MDGIESVIVTYYIDLKKSNAHIHVLKAEGPMLTHKDDKVED